MDTERVLNTIIDPNDWRPITAAPFNGLLDGKPCRIATDGTVMLVVFGDYWPPNDDLTKDVERIFAGLAPATRTASREAVIEWAGSARRTVCDKCDHGMVNPKTCDNCRGTMELTCDLGHYHTCEDCDGGRVGATCTNCDKGYINTNIVPLAIQGLHAGIDAHRIGEIVERLPGDPIGIGERDGRTAFYGDGWVMIASGVICVGRPARTLNTQEVK